MIADLCSGGLCERNLHFSVDRSRAQAWRALPKASERGLLALARAIENGATKAWLHGNNEASVLQVQSTRFLLGPGAFSTLRERAAFAPVEWSINGRAAGYRAPRGIASSELSPEGDLLGGSIHLLERHQLGRVVVVDRGISFQFGPLLGATFAIVRVTPRQGKPWPTNLILDNSLRQILGSLIRQARALEEQSAKQVSGRPVLLARLLNAVRQRQRYGDSERAQHLFELLLDGNGGSKLGALSKAF